jgi:hypothetical protein
MWTRLLVAVIVVLFLSAGAYVMKRDPVPAVEGVPRDMEAQALKVARNVVMYEKRSDTDKTFVIRARTVTQQSENLFFMDAFRMDRSDGMKIEGGHANYDTDTNRIDVAGPMIVSTPDGWRAELTDVSWDRKNKHAETRKPVTVQGVKGILTADRAEFFNDFKRMELSGHVHAKVAQKLLAD